MKRYRLIGTCSLFLFGLSLSAFDVAGPVVAGEPFPDSSLVAYRVPRPRKPSKPKISEVTLTGVISEVQLNGLTIKAGKTSRSKDQKQWSVFAQSESTAFTIRGTATPDYMRKGQIVEFSGRIVNQETGADKPQAEKVADKLQELTIFLRKGGASSLKKDLHEHVVAASGRIEAPKPDVDSETTLGLPDEALPVAGKDGKSSAAAGGLMTRIVGRIARCDETSLTVTAGERTIRADLAVMPTINVDLSLTDPKLAPDAKDKSKGLVEGQGAGSRLVPVTIGDLVGAKIVVSGTAAETKSKRQCAAKSIEVTLVRPLQGKRPASPETKKTPVPAY